MKTYLSYLIILVLLAVGIAVVILTRQQGPGGLKSDGFAVKDTETVTRIVMKEGGKKLELTNAGSCWIVNGHTPARDMSVRMLLESLSGMRVRPLMEETGFQGNTPDAHFPVIHVKVYSKFLRIQSFLVYLPGAENEGACVKRRAGGKAYGLSLPGFSGYAGSLFTTRENYWLPYTIFNLRPSEIRSVRLEYLREERPSFMIIQDSIGKPELFSYPALEQVVNPDLQKLIRYLGYFSNLQFERPVTEPDRVNIDSVLNSGPVHRIEAEDRYGKRRQLQTYHILREGRREGGEPERDLNRIFARVDNARELVIIRYMDIDPVLKDLGYFTGR